MCEDNLNENIFKLKIELETAIGKLTPGKAVNNDNILIISRKLDGVISEYVKKSIEKSKISMKAQS